MTSAYSLTPQFLEVVELLVFQDPFTSTLAGDIRQSFSTLRSLWPWLATRSQSRTSRVHAKHIEHRKHKAVKLPAGVSPPIRYTIVWDRHQAFAFRCIYCQLNHWGNWTRCEGSRVAKHGLHGAPAASRTAGHSSP
jgi:hypothetical protein